MKIIKVATVPLSLNILLKGQLSFLNKFYKIIAVSGKGLDLDELAAREKVSIREVEMKRSISPFKDFLSLLKLIKLFRQEKPEIVHSITPKAGLLAMVAAKIAGVPIRIHTFTGLIFTTKKGLFQKLLIEMDKIICKCATNIYPEGEGVKNDLIKFKITSKPLKVLGNGNINGIDIKYFNPSLFLVEDKIKVREKLCIPLNAFVYIFVGRLVGDKGVNELIEGFLKLLNFINKNDENVFLLLVGPEESKLDPLKMETIKEIEKNTNIIRVGYQKDIRPYFAVSNVLAFPSYREGFPNVVLEAGAMGLPAIVSDINGCNEIIIHNVNGLIIPAKNSQAIMESMHLLLTDKQLYQRFKGNARVKITGRYKRQQVWGALLREYRNLLKVKK